MKRKNLNDSINEARRLRKEEKALLKKNEAEQKKAKTEQKKTEQKKELGKEQNTKIESEKIENNKSIETDEKKSTTIEGKKTSLDDLSPKSKKFAKIYNAVRFLVIIAAGVALILA